jgi:hypothetical protein
VKDRDAGDTVIESRIPRFANFLSNVQPSWKDSKIERNHEGPHEGLEKGTNVTIV